MGRTAWPPAAVQPDCACVSSVRERAGVGVPRAPGSAGHWLCGWARPRPSRHLLTGRSRGAVAARCRPHRAGRAPPAQPRDSPPPHPTPGRGARGARGAGALAGVRWARSRSAAGGLGRHVQTHVPTPRRARQCAPGMWPSAPCLECVCDPHPALVPDSALAPAVGGTMGPVPAMGRPDPGSRLSPNPGPRLGSAPAVVRTTACPQKLTRPHSQAAS